MNVCIKTDIVIILNDKAESDYKGFKDKGYPWIGIKMRSKIEKDCENNGNVIARTLFPHKDIYKLTRVLEKGKLI